MHVVAKSNRWMSGFLLAAAFAVPQPLRAQPPEIFNIQFRNINFRPPAFTGFSFQQPGFQPLNGGPIPFRGIQFPGFYSRYGVPNATAARRPAVTADRYFRYRGRAPVSPERRRPLVRTARFGRREPFGRSRLAIRDATGKATARRSDVKSRRSIRTARRRPFADADVRRQ